MDAFDALDFAVALCKADGRILVSNQAFKETAAERDSLTDHSGTVGAALPSETDALRSILRSALDTRASPEHLITSLRRRSGRLPVIAKAAPIRESEVAPATLALFVLIDPEDSHCLNVSGLEAFNLLSPAELEVCEHIIRGTTTEEIAQLRSTSLNTTRDQIKSSTAKLACKSRLDLVRLALSARPPIRN
ncbi:helix-turn-helix transcriptional regulator [Ruegeria arenilitoris]|uniref:helix-turn-helix transcriptional regulator n=1 Tax=Ruegeria arenilitoris TaxID=1173585 RepID=UPI00147E5B89|nr:LuxR C-terminal-related transcriptional regulator [Ruegeria arenilitoris]